MRAAQERGLEVPTDHILRACAPIDPIWEELTADLPAQIAKDTHKTLIETGALKPETLTTAVVEVIAKRLGIRFEKLGLADTTRAAEPGTLYEFKPDELAELGKLPIEERNKRAMELRPKPSADVGNRLYVFDMISTAVGLDTDVYHKYMDALKVMKPTAAKSAWENDDLYWMRVEVGSDEYMQALADHFEVVDKDDKMRILRKPKGTGALLYKRSPGVPREIQDLALSQSEESPGPNEGVGGS